MARVWDFFSHEDDYPELDEATCCARLGRALSFPSIADVDETRTDWSVFEGLQAFMRSSFPAVFSAAEVEMVGHSLMITLPGTDASLDPVMLMGHQDVVPVVAGTEGDWTHDAFSGDVDDEYVWGRGAIDMKDMVIGELEAVEYALDHGWTLRRTLMLCFGQDEESLQSGARAMGELLLERGIHLEFLVDEGDYRIIDAAEYGAPGTPMMSVCLSEKGYCDVRLTVRSAGGHSSNPFGGTSLAILAEAVSRLASSEWPVRLTSLDQQTLAALAPSITEEPLASLVRGGEAAIERNADAIADLLLHDRRLFPLVTTTVAPTMVEGGSQASNVMPQDMWAVVNFRLLQGVTQSDVLDRCRELVADLPVEVDMLFTGNDPSSTSRADGYGFAALEHVAARYFVDPATGLAVTLVPTLACGATDARMYEPVCDSCLRFSAFVVDDEESDRGVHGTDERVTRRAYLQGIRFLIRLIDETCVRP
ncbi:MAG: M20/M25/M40 family metallo-hydrolase [Atopobiaceae bacterium]|nr:M20/M25/M40 family metallo-hydrolase [Atopobiaceae bacterium]MCI2174108.1 M20/M25/M40 family metallo-hydrolase [Atopobiaceae bacterium]MCI2206749.1 M20/M25/M40 family metallo-hydrolase [Atopobiaceae bacterium]